MLIGLLWLVAAAAQAHDPGLSRLWIKVDGERIDAEAVFSRRDLEAALGEVPLAPASLARIAGGWVTVGAARTPMQAREVLAHGGDGILIRLAGRAPAHGPYAVQFEVFDRLPRGHRQYVRVDAADGTRIAEAVLSAASPALEIAPGAARGSPGFGAHVSSGIWHIWHGLDHLLFLTSLLLPAVLVWEKPRWHPAPDPKAACLEVVKVITAFTLAHSLTLALATTGHVDAPAAVVEPLIALSVLLVALNNLRPVLPAGHWRLAFGFGLLHGFGFAGALAEVGVPSADLGRALFGFNLGVEAGQLAIVALLLPAALAARHWSWYQSLVLRAGSLASAALATAWIAQRTWGLGASGA
ncbi:MAG: HupE/UreJ family protein [Gammaproteobacteria bacterium]